MAQNAKISGLTDELIHSILRFDPANHKQAYKHAKEIASRGLRGYQYARTNQFDVTASFAGLDEKFRIKSREDLADALQTRLQRLESVTTKFTPDLLSLLLQLADRPLENTQVKALELLRPSSPPAPLTWSEILHDDPYSDDELWKDIDYGGDSSGDEKTPKKRGRLEVSPPTSIDEDDTYNAENCAIPTEKTLVEELEVAQFWKAVPNGPDAKIIITELQAIRETLFMLAGLRTSLYQIDEQQYSIRINSTYVLSHTLPVTADHLLSRFTAVGKDVYRLRQWTKKAVTSPFMQTFNAAVGGRLLRYDKSLSQLQLCYLVPDAPTAVSLLQLSNDVQKISKSIAHLARLVSDVEPQLLINPFSHLEAMFDQATLAQMTLDEDLFVYMSEMFFECLQTYLRPIRQWMEAGELGVDDETFFVFMNDFDSDAASMWHDRYVLRRDGHGQLRCPTFLQPATKKIFNTGKSVVFLRELRIRDVGLRDLEARLDHETVCGVTAEIPLLSFPELFGSAFDSWIRSKYSVASSVLRHHIFETGGLMRTLLNFRLLYFGKNGTVFEDFATSIFERMDGGRKGWNDRYILTELARGIFSSCILFSDLERIVVRPLKTKHQSQSVRSLAGISIEFALPWSIQNIIQRSSAPIYQQLFTFLLQIYRVKYVLQKVRPTRSQVMDRAVSQLSCRLRHRLTWFIDILRSYLTETVIFFTTQDMDAAMDKAEDIDEMSQIHINFVARLQERALLSREVTPIHNAILEILDCGMLFARTLGPQDGRSESTNRPRTTTDRRTTTNTIDDSSDAEHAGGSPRIDKSKTDTVPAQQTSAETLQTIETDFSRLLPFVTAGLRSVGRVGAEPMWEQLAERLEWDGRRDRA